ncbi:NAD(P)-dependent dehydrogenase (short-subunit alcohol dehydrogenase family) [Nonomuraea thailandensis]|uniref:NAD(P)-dependent dehydrogenase (Short-subunit alcohol dehydrogenase family) n=1 Tax=Nonomuraea thailandensis TaxID=1188745 RepID=A0A9X2GNM4_9ACTN|nr:SDR family oxidoreductase [Nonomuraea thailandensis]MCP2357963.1 NAD(P)-dependent dehydrogenase (short-subunit alcohol dehydrogenase family) [Nonomuraea thailandensis]
MTRGTQRLIVVTGASTGMGASAARELARRGFHVLAGVRRDRDADSMRATGVEPVILDITEPEHVAALAARVAGDPRALHAVVNNAGIQVNAPVEALPMTQWRRVFDVNLFGHVAVTQALLPALLRSRGRVVNISSVGGKAAMPTYGAYAGAKFALEAVSDSLRREVGPLGVQVVVVEPGGVRTEMAARGIATANRLAARMTPEQDERYGSLVRAINSLMDTGTSSGVSAEAAARVIAKAVTARRPRTRYTVGRDAALITRLTRILPDRTLDRVIAAGLRRHHPEAAHRAL